MFLDAGKFDAEVVFDSGVAKAAFLNEFMSHGSFVALNGIG